MVATTVCEIDVGNSQWMCNALVLEGDTAIVNAYGIAPEINPDQSSRGGDRPRRDVAGRSERPCQSRLGVPQTPISV